MTQAIAHRRTAIVILLALMVMVDCIAREVVLAINPEFFTGHNWKGTLLIIACMAAVIDGWLIAFTDFTQVQIRWPYRALEFISLLAFLIIPWGGARLDELSILAKLMAWTLIGYQMIIMARRFAKEITMDLLHLNQTPGEDPYTQTRVANARSTLQTRIVAGGVLILSAIGVARFSQAEPDRNLSGSTIDVFIYSVLGLLTIGQAQLAVLLRSWKSSKASIASGLTGDWLRSNLLLILLIATLAFALPTPVLNIANSLPKNAPRSLPSPTSSPTPAPTTTPTTTPTLSPNTEPPPLEPPSSNSLFKFLGSLLDLIPNSPSPLLAQIADNAQAIFLCIAVGISLWLFRGIFRRRILPTQSSTPGSISNRPTPSAAPMQPARFTIRRVFTPRDQVHTYYMNLLERAKQSGLERRPGQTPYEHTAKLISELPDSQEALSQLTDAFIEARYSQQDIDNEQVDEARTLWQQIKARLRIYKQKSSS